MQDCIDADINRLFFTFTLITNMENEILNIQIREDQNFIEFDAPTCTLAMTKLLRLNRLNPGPWNNAQHLYLAGKDLKNAKEYDLFLEWLGNPYNVKTSNFVVEESKLMTEDFYKKELVKFSTSTKIDGNTQVIHIKNEDWGKNIADFNG